MNYQAQQQIYSSAAINALADAKNQFQDIKNVDGKVAEGRDYIIDALFRIEDDIRIAQQQIMNIRHMYSNMKVEDEEHV